MSNIKCNSCKQFFEMEIKEEEVKDAISKVFFLCPHCDKEYISYYTNVLVKIKQKKMRDLVKKQKEVKGTNDIRQANSIYKKYEKLKKEIGKDIDNLRKRIEASTE